MAAQPKTKPVPTDREVRAAIPKMKAHNALQARQTQTSSEAPPPVDEALDTIETWAKDAADDGQEWARNSEIDANARIRESTQWQDRVREDDKRAAEEAKTREETDVNQVREDMKKALDDYQAAIREKADDGEEWAKAKLKEIAREHADAKRALDEGLEGALETAAEAKAGRRQKTRLIAEKMAARSKPAEQWMTEYAGQPVKYAEGQRLDVKHALPAVMQWAEQAIELIEPLGSKASAHVEALERAREWARTLEKQLAAAGKAPGPRAEQLMDEAKVSGTVGSAETRDTKARLEIYFDEIESEGNAATDVFARWTGHNNKLAAQWIECDSAKHRKWAEEWMKTQAEE